MSTTHVAEFRGRLDALEWRLRRLEKWEVNMSAIGEILKRLDALEKAVGIQKKDVKPEPKTKKKK